MRRLLFLALVGLVVVSCGNDSSPSGNGNPTNPTNPTNPGAPHIVSLSPGSPKVSGTAQTLTVTGERFATGLTVTLDAPSGVWTDYSGSAINVQSPTRFTATVMLNMVGRWDITVNPGAGESNEVQFSVAQ